MSWILYSLVWLVLAVHQADSSGVFELRLKSFDNQAGKDDLGKCCNGTTTGPYSKCSGPCLPRFVICLKEYQTKIDTTSPCTFGNRSTSVLESISGNDLPLVAFDNPISLTFNFTWLGTFSLIVEVWHGNFTSPPGVLISRLTRQKFLEVGVDWTEDAYSSKYTTLQFEYRVTCAEHYYGQGCEVFCRPRNDTFGHFTCSTTGKRLCHSGWTGDYCGAPRCLLGCDAQHGQCSKPNECTCQVGWKGRFCNECERHPGCIHGTCEKPWECQCKEGWGGLFCNQDLNFCTNHKPCRNGGTCFNTGQGSYTCSCPVGFTGTKCDEIAINDCTHSKCFNGGTCTRNETFNHYSYCVCPRGYHGPHCENFARSCVDNPCRNHGTCTDTDSGFRCSCVRGYTGTDCGRQINDCFPNPCKNNGSCVDVVNGYQCNCPSGFTGPRCESNIDDCIDHRCLNGGTCVDQINDYRCQCVPGYVGKYCETSVDYCLAKPCANGGTCIKLVNDYKCECVPGFTGKDCSAEIDECQSHPCQHGGTCINRVDSFECNCHVGFLGHTCEETASSAAPSAQVSSDSNLTTKHVVVIATISTFVPLLVLVAVGVIICLKQRRKRERARADEEARLQNEQNTAHSSFAKRGAAIAAEAHMIKNSWGKCTNNVLSTSTMSSPDDCSVSNVSVSDNDCFPKALHQVIDGRPVYTLQRSRSQKQLNTEPGPRASALLVAKLHEPEFEHIKRLSVMSNSSAVCGTSDPSLLKRPMDKEPSGVYVIEEHFHRPDALSAGLFATEV